MQNFKRRIVTIIGKITVTAQYVNVWILDLSRSMTESGVGSFCVLSFHHYILLHVRKYYRYTYVYKNVLTDAKNSVIT